MEIFSSLKGFQLLGPGQQGRGELFVGFLRLLALDSDVSNKRTAGVEGNLGQLVLSAAHH